MRSFIVHRVEGKEVLEFLAEKTTASEEDASLVIAQLVDALTYLHKKNIVHLDIRVRMKTKNNFCNDLAHRSKEETSFCSITCPSDIINPIDAFALILFQMKQPANLFVSRDFKLTLIDYGNARRIQSPDGQFVDAVGVTEFTGGK